MGNLLHRRTEALIPHPKDPTVAASAKTMTRSHRSVTGSDPVPWLAVLDVPTVALPSRMGVSLCKTTAQSRQRHLMLRLSRKGSISAVP